MGQGIRRIVLIKSCQKFNDRLLAVEDTWLPRLRANFIPCFSFVGGKELQFKKTQLGGRVVLPTADDYKNNTIKVQMALKLLLENYGFEYVFVCDDDTFIHPGRWLKHLPDLALECRKFTPGNKKRNEGHPWITGGSGWYMSRRLCEYYVQECNIRDSCDDIVAANVAREHKMIMDDRPDLYGGDHYSKHNDRVSSFNSLMTCHPFLPQAMRELYDKTMYL